MKLGIIADDNTGATDAAGMLTEQGIKTLLLFRPERIPEERTRIAGFEAVVVATRIRSLPPGCARQLAGDALAALRAAGCDKFQLKYCSTFDSTREGNIGPTLDACLDVLGQRATVVCPALPVNGRRVYQGHLFVGQALLSDSPLRDHPLNPMTDSNIARWLQHQTKRKVALVPLETLRNNPAALAACVAPEGDGGISYRVVDAIDDDDLLRIAEACRDLPFVSGGSGLTTGLARAHFPVRPPLDFRDRRRGDGPVLAISGSMSPATRAQNEWALAHGFAAAPIHAGDAVRGLLDTQIRATEVVSLLARGGRVLVRTDTTHPGEIQEIQSLGRSLGLSEVQTGERIAQALARIARAVCDACPPRLLIASGGETSGAVCEALEIAAAEVGLPVEPGVPYVFPTDRPGLTLVLKSGNFGSGGFYGKAIEATCGT